MTRIVTLGDSITLGMGDPDPSGGWRGWARHLAAGLPDPELHNLAVLGAQAKHVERDQLPAALQLRPDVASVVVGINDTLRAGFDPVRYRSGRRQDRRRAAGRRRHRADHAAAGPGADVRAARRAGQAAVAADARGQHRARQGRPPGTGPCTGTPRSDPETYERRNWSVDRLHPNERGHRLIACRLWDSLAAAGHAVAARPDPSRPTRGRPAATTSCGWPPRGPSGSCGVLSTSFLTCCSWRLAKR